jgi:hypothetical protein
LIIRLAIERRKFGDDNQEWNEDELEEASQLVRIL